MSQARFSVPARREFLAEVAYYREIQPALGERFAKAVEHATELALAFPDAGIPSFANTRRVLVKGFPFSLIYLPKPYGILIVAVAHHARRPGYWRKPH